MMRYKYIVMVTTVLFVLASCSKTLKIDSLSFDVTTPSKSYNAGDTVHFMFKGQPDMITFYSGGAGHNYEYRERTVAKGEIQVQFTSYAQYGTQKNSLHLLVSNDFDGTYETSNIHNATWTDLTDDATLSTGSPDVPSGIINLSAYVTEGKPFYFAFKYTSEPDPLPGKTWHIKDFKINMLLDGGALAPIADMTTGEFTPVNVKGTNGNKGFWQLSGDEFLMRPGKPDANEDWLITKALNPSKVSPDRGVPIKDITEELTTFDHVYDSTGTYKAVFIATNASSDEESSVIKSVEVTVK